MSSLIVPLDRLPGGDLDRIRGRDEIKRGLLKVLQRPPRRAQVLAGMPGVGKTTLAVFVAETAKADAGRRGLVWWVSAVNKQTLLQGLATVARELGATQADVDAIRSGSGDGPRRLWRPLSGRKDWVLVLDNLDEPAALDPAHAWLSLADLGTGLVVVTTRQREPYDWGSNANVVPVRALAADDGAKVLRDLAPASAGDHEAARALAAHLGGLPLGLHLAGRLVSSTFAEVKSFDDLRGVLNVPGSAVALDAGTPDGVRDPRSTLTQTFELSLEALDRHGMHEARALLRLLSCFAAATPIPVDPVLARFRLPVLATSPDPRPNTAVGIRRALSGLLRVGLIDQSTGGASTSRDAVVVHPLIADVHRAHLADALVAGSAGRPGASGPSEAVAVTNAAVEVIVHALDPFTGISILDLRSRQHLRVLSAHLRELLRCPVTFFDADHRARLVLLAASVGEVFVDDRDERAGEALAQAAIPHAERLPPDHPAALQLRHTLGHAALQLGRCSEAEHAMRRVRAERTRVLGPQHRDTFETRRWLAWSLLRQGHVEQAESELHDLLDHLARTSEADAAQELHARCMYSWVLCCRGRLKAAEESYQKVIDARMKTLRVQHPDTLDARHSLGMVLLQQGDGERAQVVLSAVATDRVRELGTDHPDTLESRGYAALASALYGRQRALRARRELAAIVAVQERRLGPDHPRSLEMSKHLRALAAVTGSKPWRPYRPDVVSVRDRSA